MKPISKIWVKGFTVPCSQSKNDRTVALLLLLLQTGLGRFVKICKGKTLNVFIWITMDRSICISDSVR